MWKLLVLQKPASVSTVFNVKAKGVESDDLIHGFTQMLEMVNRGTTFLSFISNFHQPL